MKKLYEEQKNTLYEIHKKTGLNKDTLYRYINSGYNVENMRFSTLEKIAKAEEIEPSELLKKMKEYQNKNNVK